MSDAAINEPTVLAGIEQQDASPAAMAPGAQLASLRKARGWSIEEVAMQLNLAPRQVVAIEADNYAALPGIASTRGFVRGYAKILKIDAAPLLKMMANEPATLSEPVQQRRVLSEPFSETRLPSMGRQDVPSKSIFVVGFLVVLLLAAFAAQHFGLVPDLSDSVSSKIKDIASASASGSGTTAASAAASLPQAEPGTSAPATASSAANPAPAPASVPVVAPSAAARPTVAVAPSVAAPAEAPAAPQKNALVLTLHQDSWVEITRANRTVLFSRLLKAGARETIEIPEPVSITIGNVAGVEATWRGAPLDVKSGTKTNVNRLSLK